MFAIKMEPVVILHRLRHRPTVERATFDDQRQHPRLRHRQPHRIRHIARRPRRDPGGGRGGLPGQHGLHRGAKNRMPPVQPRMICRGNRKQRRVAVGPGPGVQIEHHDLTRRTAKAGENVV